MFIPLGFAMALAARSSRKAAVLAGAFALPFLIEATQLVVTPLRRGCQSADVTDNLTGLVLGLTAGTVVAWLAPVVARMIAMSSS
jgi:glycopeptide antibiotics resistance protein